jgi:hypothetical protein
MDRSGQTEPEMEKRGRGLKRDNRASNPEKGAISGQEKRMGKVKPVGEPGYLVAS